MKQRFSTSVPGKWCLWFLFAKEYVWFLPGEQNFYLCSHLFISKFPQSKHKLWPDILSLDDLPDLGLAFKKMLCAMSGRTNRTGFSGCPHLAHHYAAMTPAYAPSPLVAVGCVVQLMWSSCGLARKHDSAGWVTDYSQAAEPAFLSGGRVLVQTFLINPTDFHKMYRNFLIFEVYSPLANLVEAGQQIQKMLAGSGRQQEGISSISKCTGEMTNQKWHKLFPVSLSKTPVNLIGISPSHTGVDSKLC